MNTIQHLENDPVLRDEIGIKWLPQFDPALFPFLREEVASTTMKAKHFRDGRIVVGYALVVGRKTMRRFFYLMPRDFDPDAMERRDWICGAVDTASIGVGKPARKATRENYEAAANLSSGQRKMLASLFAANRPKRRAIGPKRARRKRCPKFPGASVVGGASRKRKKCDLKELQWGPEAEKGGFSGFSLLCCRP